MTDRKPLPCGWTPAPRAPSKTPYVRVDFYPHRMQRLIDRGDPSVLVGVSAGNGIEGWSDVADVLMFALWAHLHENEAGLDDDQRRVYESFKNPDEVKRKRPARIPRHIGI